MYHGHGVWGKRLRTGRIIWPKKIYSFTKKSIQEIFSCLQENLLSPVPLRWKHFTLRRNCTITGSRSNFKALDTLLRLFGKTQSTSALSTKLEVTAKLLWWWNILPVVMFEVTLLKMSFLRENRSSWQALGSSLAWQQQIGLQLVTQHSEISQHWNRNETSQQVLQVSESG